ncbi:MAG TPA: DUF2269 family protein [Candidatus Dormibacteraeota bacterium]|nr:DUF2269 family protein [Candidatus Dormibacteraeota bacterium]
MTVTWYTLLKYLHVLLAITALGSNVTYGVWNTLAAREPAHAPFALRGIAFIDQRVANPAYGGLLVTGLVLLAVGQWGFRGWVIASLILFALLIVVAIGFYSRVVRQQIQAMDTEGLASVTYKRLEGQATTYGIISLVIALLIVFMMVVKPFP